MKLSETMCGDGMADEGFADRVSGLASLAEPVRLELYRYVAGHADAVGRDQAAEGVGVPRHTAKFHLDKLVDEGLLEVEFRRLTGRDGPGAGRPAKLYRRSGREVSVTVPDREYELAGQLMAAAINRRARSTPSGVFRFSRTLRTFLLWSANGRDRSGSLLRSR